MNQRNPFVEALLCFFFPPRVALFGPWARPRWEGVLEKNGIISVDSFEEMTDCAYAFHNLPLPKGSRIAMVMPRVGRTRREEMCEKIYHSL